jgi:tagatose-1,6-bisphosphate aldolase non-catalytic subunit AgaZ/GatZ
VQKLEQERIPEPIFSKQLAQQWQTIEEENLKNQIREKISQRWTNEIADEDVDWWEAPPRKSMKIAKRIYEQG